MIRRISFGSILALVLALAIGAVRPAAAAPLKIAYSDWPGWIAWEVGIEKGWFKEAGVDVEFDGSTTRLDGGLHRRQGRRRDDDQRRRAGHRRRRRQERHDPVTDYWNGNDMIVAKPGIKSLKELKGKKIGLEVGLVEHLLLLKGLEKAGMKETDVEAGERQDQRDAAGAGSGQVDAIGAWQPISGQALKALPGSRPIFTTAEAPGLIYDVVAVKPQAWRRSEGRLGEGRQGLGSRRALHRRPEDPGRGGEDHGRARRASRRRSTSRCSRAPSCSTSRKGKKVFEKADGLGSLYGSTKSPTTSTSRTRSTRSAGRRQLHRSVADRGAGK